MRLLHTTGVERIKSNLLSPLPFHIKKIRSHKDKINGPINETFVLNCPKCASHFKSSPLLEQHLKTEHNICDYAGVHLHNRENESGMEIIAEEGTQENDEEDTLIMSGEQDDTNDENDYDGPQDNGQDVPYSGGQNVVSGINI